MQTFKQFLEAREVKDIPHNNIIQILQHINDKTISVKFALYCAEDCFQFNNEQTRGPAQRCIDLIKKWLRDPKSVTRNEIDNVSFNAYSASCHTQDGLMIIEHADSSACYAACNAVNTITDADNFYYANETSIYASVAYANNRVGDENQHTFNWSEFNSRKLLEYTEKLKSMTVTRSGNLYASQNILHASQEEDIVRGLNIAFDELEDLGNYDFIYQKDNKWIFDLHYTKLEGKSRDDLINKIANDKYYLDAFRRLYYEETK